MSKELIPKLKAAYEHGRMDYYAGAPYNPKTPLAVYDNLSKIDQAFIMSAWSDGYRDAEEMSA